MAEFSYECVDRTGKVTKGRISAVSREGAVKSLRDQGYIPTSIKELDDREPRSVPGFGSVSIDRLSVFTRKFAELVKTDIPITQVFEILAEEEKGFLLPEAARHVAYEIGKGRAVDEAMMDRPRVFSRLYIKMIEAGLRSGTLDIVAQNLAKLYEAENVMRKQIIGKLVYPIVLLVFSFLISIILRMVKFITPELFSFLMGIWLIIGALAIFGMTRPGYALYRQIGFKTPGIGGLMRKIQLGRFCRIFSLQYEAGVPILEGLETSKEVLQDPELERAVDKIQRRINNGMDLRDAIISAGVFPKRVAHMVGTGEHAGSVSTMFQKLAEYYDSEIDMGSNILTTVLYFVVYLAVALTVVVIVLSAWGSYFSLINSLM